MGTTLTGTTPQDTYDSLIKVTDNAPLTGSLKKLTDGLGNDSSLSLSTTAASLSGTLAVTGATTLSSTISAISLTTTANNTFNNSSGRAFDATSSGALLAATTAAHDIIFGDNNVRYFSLHTPSGAASMSIRNFTTSTNILTCLQAGNVGIGTSTPAVKLDVVGDIRSSTGILFGADTAAANLLDDYEEGTFTPTTAGDATGAFSATLGEYTKIGNVVNFRIGATISTNFTAFDIGGLPFTVGGSGSPSGVVNLISIANASSAALVGFTAAGNTIIRFCSDNNINNTTAPTTTMGTLRMFGTYRV